MKKLFAKSVTINREDTHKATTIRGSREILIYSYTAKIEFSTFGDFSSIDTGVICAKILKKCSQIIING